MDRLRELEPTLVDYSRQQAFNEQIPYATPSSLVVIGCGGIGFWLALMFCMTGNIKKLTIFDGERIEASNLNRLPVPQTWIGKPKVLCLQHMIHMIRPEVSVVSVKSHVTEDSKGILRQLLISSSNLVVDTTDDARAQSLIYSIVKDAAKEFHTQYVKVGYEGHNIGAVAELNAWIPADYRPGYRTTNANAITSAVAAGFGIYKILFGDKRDMKLNLKEFVNSPLQEAQDKKTTPIAEPEQGIRPRRRRTTQVVEQVTPPQAHTPTGWTADSGDAEGGIF